MKSFKPEDVPPTRLLIPLGLQHLLAMFGATVLVPFLFKADASICILMNGIGTLIYLFVCRGKVPAYLGSSFAFIAPVLAVLSKPELGGFAAAQSGFIAFGLFFIAMSFLIRKFGTGWLDLIFPPAAMGAIVIVIGLELAPVAAQMAGLVGTPGVSTNVLIVSMATLAMSTLGSMWFRGWLATIPILLGVLGGYLLSCVLGLVDFNNIGAASWLRLPEFHLPIFSLEAILIIFPAGLVVLAEHISHLVVTGEIVGRDYMRDPGLDRSLLGDGISNLLSGFVGSTPNTTYGENIGVMAITKVYSTAVIACAACFAIALAFFGKLAAVIQSIPVPVMGGICLFLFGVISVSGIRMLIEKRVDYTKSKNLVLTSVPLVVGLSGISFRLGQIEFKGMILATLVGIAIALLAALPKFIEKR